MTPFLLYMRQLSREPEAKVQTLETVSTDGPVAANAGSANALCTVDPG